MGSRVFAIVENGPPESTRKKVKDKTQAKEHMMSKKHIVRLTPSERNLLECLVRKGKAAAYKRLHAQVLLKADIGENGPSWKDQQISDAFNITIRSIERIRKRLVELGFDAAIQRAKGSGRQPKFTGEDEAHLVALACSETPEGRSRWTLRLLADSMVQLKHVDSISHESVRRLLKKRN